jgi:hypothetical protein
MRRFGSVLAGVLLMVVVVSAPAAGTGRSLGSVPGCTLAGTHYLGTTSQGQKVCLTISGGIPSGKALLREYVFASRSTCAGVKSVPGYMHVTPGLYETHIGPLPPGAFGSTVGYTIKTRLLDYREKYVSGIPKTGRVADDIGGTAVSMRLSGQITGGTVKGTLFQRIQHGGGFDGPTCRTGTVRWTARPAGPGL